ncbi:hypothetical protein [Mycobacterium sp. 1081908.1]|uniref:hypothetical protein n=1 Tax=Mycobacterium sp. 1081908.1 TaxID=1834066 RepID=UPI0007FFAF86|nr:hypothetical protein [Mycobacterium sp. 1081908.1]OBK43101.1 hypothetical protein A5655_17335 [Mycobacterium sp. 1081908.1]
MTARVKTAIAMFGGTTALALAVGFGGVGVSPVGGAPAPTTHASSSVTSAHPDAVAPAGGAGVQAATLASCVSGLDC